MLHYFIITSSFLLLSFGAFSEVGPVDSAYGKKAAACEYGQESAVDKTANREINLANIVANIVGVAVPSTPQRDSKRRRRSKGSSGATR